MQIRWPLHPKPRSYETLERYVHRLAECYCVSYGTFCLRALGIPIEDGQSRLFREPTIEVLQRLSNGSGIAVDVLEQMTLARIWDRQMEELRQSMETTDVKLE